MPAGPSRGRAVSSVPEGARHRLRGTSGSTGGSAGQDTEPARARAGRHERGLEGPLAGRRRIRSSAQTNGVGDGRLFGGDTG